MRTVQGRYALQRELGEGASGSVWVAEDLQLRRQVAVKLLREALVARKYERFEREAWLLAQLRSVHVVQVYDAGRDGEQPFIVMELLQGESLEARLRRHPCLPLPIIADLVEQIAIGLAATHQAGIVHCDLKPANVFLARESGREIVKLLDFGVATVPMPPAEGSENEHARASGTIPYMSPEQFDRVVCHPSADIWSLAVLAYQMLVGQPPFQGESVWSVATAICAGTFAPPSRLLAGVGGEVDAFFIRAFARDAAGRPTSALQLAAELRELVEEGRDITLRLLFIDDEPDMEFLIKQRLRRYLQDEKHELFFARSGEQGLDELRRRPDIDVVLTDINMPGMDGLTLLSHVAEVNPVVRVVVVSAYGDMTNIRLAMNRGAFDFLCKPIDFDDLCQTIRKCSQHVRILRSALASGEENSAMRVLVRSTLGERLLDAVRRGAQSQHTVFMGCVVHVRLRDEADGPREDAAFDTLIQRLDAFFELLMPEVRAAGGHFHHFGDGCFVLLFDGADPVRRAVEACLALRERLRAARSGPFVPHDLAIAIDVGALATGSVGSVALGHVAQVLLGEPMRRGARVRSGVPWDEILLSSQAAAALDRDYPCEPTTLGETGSHEDLTVFRLLGRSRARPTPLLPATVESVPVARPDGGS